MSKYEKVIKFFKQNNLLFSRQRINHKKYFWVYTQYDLFLLSFDDILKGMNNPNFLSLFFELQ